MKQPVSVDKSGEVDAVNGTRAPVRKPDRASPKDLSNKFHQFVPRFFFQETYYVIPLVLRFFCISKLL